MISNMFHVDWGEVENRGWREYSEMREQAFNIGGWQRGGELKLLSDEEQMRNAEKELARIRADRGRRERMEERIAEAKKTINESRRNKR